MKYHVLPIEEIVTSPFDGSTLSLSAKLHLYLADDLPVAHINCRRLVLICPGGGYEMVSDLCAEPIAFEFLAAGFHAAVLQYTVAPNGHFPTQLMELARAVALIRTHAEEWHCDSDHIVLCGFSAGGHLAASYATLWNRPFLSETLSLSHFLLRPNGVILSYPVISAGEYAHRRSFDNLLGEHREDASLLELLSAECQVGAHTPPMFIWHTFADQVVPVENALLMASALAEHRISTELHLFPQGGHGLSLCDERTAPGPGSIQPDCAVWIEMAKRWVTQLP